MVLIKPYLFSLNSKIPKHSVWIGLVCCLPFFAQAQQALSSTGTPTQDLPAGGRGSIQGLVLDAENGALLPAATIRLANSTLGAVTDLEGRFYIKDLPAGYYDLSASYLGYSDQLLKNVLVTAAKPVHLTLSLQPSNLEVAELVVTASSHAQSLKLAPASVGIITDKQLQARHVRTFDQAFDEMPGVVVARSSGANVQAFSIRGASEVAGGGIGNRVLLLIDGRPALSPESGGALWNLVPLGAIERIEVVRGAYSSLYGSSAMGGVVNVITRNPTDAPETRVQLNYGTYDPASGYPGYNDFKALAASHSRRIGKFSYLLDGSWKADDGHRQKSGFDLLNLFAKTSWEFRPGHHLQFSANTNQIWNDTPASWLSFRDAYKVASYKLDDYQNRRERSADLYYYAIPTDRLKYSSRFYHYSNHSRFSFDGDPGNDSTNVNIGKQSVGASDVRSRRLGNVTQIDLFTRAGHCLVAGLDAKLDYVLGRPDTVLYGEHRAFGIGVYAQDEFAISKKLTATAGLRFDNYRIAGQVMSSNLSPKLAMLYKAAPKISLRMLLAQAFRDPPIAERYIKFEQGGGLSFLPNPGLKAERLSLSAELGAKFSPAPGASLDVAFFYNHYKNLISFQQLSDPFEPLLYQVINLRAAVMQGIELSYRQQFGKLLSLNAAYTFLDARDISENRLNDALAYKVRHSFGLGATATYKAVTLNANCRYRSRIEEVFIYPGSEPDAVFIANTKLGYSLPGSRCAAFFAVDNIGNARYEELERYRMAGRSFSLGLSVRL